MNCPRCNVVLTMSNRDGVEIDYCAQCRGVWLDRGELDKIIERANQYYGRRDDDDDDDDDRRRHAGRAGHAGHPADYRGPAPGPGPGYPPPPYPQQYPPQGYYKKKKSFWQELFD